MESSARFSDCRLYRYELWRIWENSKNYCMFIGLNPSIADETLNDPTVRRCIDYAQRWGYGALCMTNIFAYRATDPNVMMKIEEPIGFDNDRTLKTLSSAAGIVIAAWGKHGSHINRGKQIIDMIPSLHCLKRNGDGSPAHPLYLKKTLEPQLL